MSRLAWSLLAGFAAGLALAACGGGSTNTCNARTCGGCCDADGKCQSGTTTGACGVDGASCGRCGSGTVCFAGECRAEVGGGGGGGSGGGAGGGTGGGAGGGGCRQVPAFTSANVFIADYWAFQNGGGHYNVARFAQPGPSNPDGLGIEIVYPNDVGPTAPFSQAITSAGYKSCTVCSVFFEGCNNMFVCDKVYLARSGTVNISRADRAEAGRMIGSASTLHFVEWDLSTDVAVANGGCIDVGQLQAFDVGWNHDGGSPPP